MNFARVWTSFTRQSFRSNTAARSGLATANFFDPNDLDIRAHISVKRDVFPKLNLYDRHLGDGYPICSERPLRTFLRAGAKYNLLGNSAEPKLQEDPTSWEGSLATPRLTLDPSASALYRALCADPANGGACTFPLTVTLSSHLACDGRECAVDTARVVRLTSAGNVTQYYEYVPDACVELTFYSDAKLTWDSYKKFCLDPVTIGGGAMCCDHPTNMWQTSQHQCEYLAERVAFDTAAARCTAVGKHLCPSRPSGSGAGGCGFSATGRGGWTSQSCSLQVQVDPEDGWVNVVHSDTSDAKMREGSGNLFPVRWVNGTYPTPQDGCFTGNATLRGGNGYGVCEVGTVNPETCVCNLEINTSVVFGDASAVPSADELSELLSMGSDPPTAFDAGTYALCTTAACTAASPAVRVYLHSSSGGAFDAKTIFQIQVNGTTANLRNTLSTVHVGEYSFRNPPHFVSFIEPTKRDGLYEVDALLDHLFYHRNVAPFVAHRLVQRLVTSNPSPRYIREVATAFSTGSHDRVTYSGQYGDLRATVAAVLLDREARSSTLDLDPSHGQLREPLLKVLQLMRSLEYVSDSGREVELHGLPDSIGQQIFYSPTVFNFFLPDYQPTGPVIQSNLFSPEAQLQTAPSMIGFLNGVSSLVRFGLSSCSGGFATSAQDKKHGSRYCDRPAQPEWDRTGALDASSSDGRLTFTPSAGENASASQIVAELDLLLTAGRLSQTSRSILEYEHDAALNGTVNEYRNATFRTCAHWKAHNLTTLEECSAAAAALGYISPTAADDEKSDQGYRPRGCYFKKYGSTLYFNAAGTNRGACQGGYICLCSVRSAEHALQRTTQLLLATAEFHATNAPQPTATPRPPPPSVVSAGRPYKAILILFLAGGADSWNLLVPHSGCIPGNATTNYETYSTIRAGAALPHSQLLPISAPSGTQPHSVCTKFGVHPSLPHLKTLYDAGDAAFLANFGTLIEVQAARHPLLELPQPARAPPRFIMPPLLTRFPLYIYGSDLSRWLGHAMHLSR